MSPDLHRMQRTANTTDEVNDKVRQVTSYNFDNSPRNVAAKERNTQDANRGDTEHDKGVTNTLSSGNHTTIPSPERMLYEDTVKEVVQTSQRKESYYNTALPKLTPDNPKTNKDGYEKGPGEAEHIAEKPNHSYISLIACAVLASPEKRLVLSDIYNFILENFTYFRNKGPGWRNSIRHNLSLNECFIKAGRSPNGKGHYWAIHPNNYEDFLKGDFRRRRAQRRTKRMIGIPDLDEPAHPLWYQPYSIMKDRIREMPLHTNPYPPPPPAFRCTTTHESYRHSLGNPLPTKDHKRGFDIESILKKDDRRNSHHEHAHHPSSKLYYTPCTSCKQECCNEKSISSYPKISHHSYPNCCACTASTHSSITPCFKGSSCWCSASSHHSSSSICTGQSKLSSYSKTYRTHEVLDFR